MHQGSVQYLTVTLKASVDITADPVDVSVDGGTTWHPATWLTNGQGVRLLVGPGTPTGALPLGVVPVLARPQDSPETEWVDCGSVYVEP